MVYYPLIEVNTALYRYLRSPNSYMKISCKAVKSCRERLSCKRLSKQFVIDFLNVPLPCFLALESMPTSKTIQESYFPLVKVSAIGLHEIYSIQQISGQP